MNTIDQQIQDEILKRLADSSCGWTLIETGPAYCGIESKAIKLILSADSIIIGIGDIGCELPRPAHEDLAASIRAKYADTVDMQRANAKQAILTALTQ